MEALQQPTIRVVAVIAEGVPERDTKKLIAYARANNKIIIGPATVGGMQVRTAWSRGLQPFTGAEMSFGRQKHHLPLHFRPSCVQAGAFRIGDTAGTLENIVACKLYRPGSVGFVSKSGGMSNEMYNVLSRATDGLYEGQRILTPRSQKVGCTS